MENWLSKTKNCQGLASLKTSIVKSKCFDFQLLKSEGEKVAQYATNNSNSNLTLLICTNYYNIIMVLFDNDDQYFRYKKIIPENYKLISMVNSNCYSSCNVKTKRKIAPNYYGLLWKPELRTAKIYFRSIFEVLLKTSKA